MAKTSGRRFYTTPTDDGRHGRNIEIDARIASYDRTKRLAVAPVGKADLVKYSTRDGIKKRYHVEIKTNGGSVTATYVDNVFANIDLRDRAVLDAYVLPQAHYVAYGVGIDASSDANEDLFVFTRAQFLDFLTGFTSKTNRPQPMVRVNRKMDGYCLNLQDCKHPAQHRRLEYAVLSCLDRPCLGDWIADMERKGE